MTETLAGRCPYPAAVAALPVCPKRKLPIPFSAARDDENGHPEIGVFTIADPDKVETCHRYRLCGVCGQPLGYWIAFLGGPGSARPDNGAYQDPPMHEECAEAAIKLCPYIAHRRVPRRTPTVKIRQATAGSWFVADKRTDGKPWVMVITRSYRTRLESSNDGDPVRVFLPRHDAKTRIRRFAYEGDTLAEVAG